MEISTQIDEALASAIEFATELRNEFVTPEHFLPFLLNAFNEHYPATAQQIKFKSLEKKLQRFFEKLEVMPESEDYKPEISFQLQHLLNRTKDKDDGGTGGKTGLPDAFYALMFLEESQASYFFKKSLQCTPEELIAYMLTEAIATGDIPQENFVVKPDPPEAQDDEEDEEERWEDFVVCLNDNIKKRNPLIGRETELERTIQVLCRKDKNNPLHVGEPGVGKTALTLGLVARIEEGDVPERLRRSKVYQLDMATLLAGTHYRGDFEKRLKTIMEGLSAEEDCIVYIDEIHNLVGAGAISDGSLDAANILKPYLEAGDIRFIGATTYEEYNLYFAKSKSLVRRFQQIDIKEPSVEEAVGILDGLRKRYAKFHGVTYPKDVVRYAVEASAKYISNRCLPDKAIDLLDEAGAYLETKHEFYDAKPKVTREVINDILAKVCKIDAQAMKEESNEALSTLRERMAGKVFGQDLAIDKVVEAVQTAKAGLLEEDKPLANLLFVGPTGVGKTEIAKVLSRELGIELVRFDMSEYAEKHAVAKLIGSPAGYVGYENGGLLTDAIRRTPNCVLLLDEIEKAHEDIYNILLQVMDYARLTDNKGQKADFRNVILILTSNAGAQYAAQANVGFNGSISAGEAMLTQVKKIFKPEFINRLTATVVFNEMNHDMATRILQRKLKELGAKLAARKITLSLTKAAEELLLKRGFTRKYGAREMDRAIASLLKPLLTQEILFGKLRKGGHAKIEVKDEKLQLGVSKK